MNAETAEKMTAAIAARPFAVSTAVHYAGRCRGKSGGPAVTRASAGDDPHARSNDTAPIRRAISAAADGIAGDASDAAIRSASSASPSASTAAVDPGG